VAGAAKPIAMLIVGKRKKPKGDDRSAGIEAAYDDFVAASQKGNKEAGMSALKAFVQMSYDHNDDD
jgi:hypothetical protein